MDVQVIAVSKDSLHWQCSILKIGGFTVLLNCGWTESLDTKLLAPLVPHLSVLDLIILTHGDFRHLGALPHVLTKYPVSCPVICTEPVCRLGELSCVSCLEDREKYREPSDGCDVDDVLRIFMSRLTPLNYRETFPVQAQGRVLTACAYPAGGQIGSAYWTLHCGSLSAVYFVDCNLRNSRYLEGMEVQRLLPSCRGTAQRWDVVITAPLPQGTVLQKGAHQLPEESASKALKVARTVWEHVLLEETIAALRRGGTVLIPADAAGSVPELLLLLEAAWGQDRQLATHYPLVWLSSMGDMVLDQIKTRLEFMSREVLTNFESRLGSNPFVLKNVRIFQTLEELAAVHPLSRPKVILTTSPHLEGGDSRELMLRLCSDPRTLLWLLGTPPSGSWARQILSDFVIGSCSKKEYRIQHYLKQALPDEELRAFYEAKLQEQELDRDIKEEGTETKDLKDKEKESKGRVAEELRSRLPRERGGTVSGSLWSPLGWPNSRTMAHSEWRTEGDEYGHLLAAAELRAWKAEDQEGNKYSGTSQSAPSPFASASPVDEAPKAKDEVKEEVNFSDGAEWRQALQLHFREPMRCEVRERSVRVACRVRSLPDSAWDQKDLHTLLQLMNPRHIVFLPAAVEAGTAQALEQELLQRRGSCPTIHVLNPKDVIRSLPLRNMKRKVQLSQDLWPAFQKISDGVRVARIRGRLDGGSDARVLELDACEVNSDEPMLALPGPAQVTEAHTQPVDANRLPRQAALFVGSSEPLALSGLKDMLRAAEGEVQVEFGPPGSKRPWSDRVLIAGAGKAAVGWTHPDAHAFPVLRLEGVPGEEFFMARAALYKHCAVI